MPLSRNQKALIHVAKGKLGLDDDNYRAILTNLLGVTSSTEMEQEDFETLLGFFEHLGFNPQRRTAKNYGKRQGMATFAQLQLIHALWEEYKGTFDGAAFQRWLEYSFTISNERFITFDKAQKIITALKAMKTRQKAQSTHSGKKSTTAL